MKIAVVSAASADYAELALTTQPTREAYCQRHGYTPFFFEVPKTLGDACKRECYEHLWGRGFDLFVWMDCDSIIWNSTIRIEDICRDHMGYREWLSNDRNNYGALMSAWDKIHHLWGADHAGPNSGVYFTRFTSQGRQFLDRSYATMLENGLADETAMEQVMLIRGLGEYAKVGPGHVLNAYDPALFYGDRYAHRINQLGDDSLVLHQPGWPNEKRIPELRRRAEEARKKWG